MNEVLRLVGYQLHLREITLQRRKLNTKRHARCCQTSFHFIHHRATSEDQVRRQLGVVLEVRQVAARGVAQSAVAG